MNPFAYIQEYYGVPAEVARRVKYTGDAAAKEGVITEARGHYIMIHFDGTKKTIGPFHPTWEIEYLGMGTLPKVKNSRGAARYQRWLDVGDCFNSFRDFLIHDTEKERVKKLGFGSLAEYDRYYSVHS